MDSQYRCCVQFCASFVRWMFVSCRRWKEGLAEQKQKQPRSNATGVNELKHYIVPTHMQHINGEICKLAVHARRLKERM